MPTVAGPWRRFLRVSVRGMIVVVLLVGGWLGWIVRSARIQREAVAAINKQGGHAIYDGWHWDNDRLTNGKPWPPKWLANAIGVHYFANVTDVMIVDPFDDTLCIVPADTNPSHMPSSWPLPNKSRSDDRADSTKD